VNLFLDTSVVLAACGSTTGASSEICRLAGSRDWLLIVTPYVIAEVEANLPDLAPAAHAAWEPLKARLELRDDIFTLDRPTTFGPAKDRPILFSALAWADVLLTLDRADFGTLMGQRFYGLRVLRPGKFLEEERAADRIH
jgi:predicted nucleic acid-binding protein